MRRLFCLLFAAACGVDDDERPDGPDGPDGPEDPVEATTIERCLQDGGRLVEVWSVDNQHGPVTHIVAGDVIVLGAADGSVKQWSFEGDAPEYGSPFTTAGSEIGGIALTSDGHIAAATSNGELTEWRLADAHQTRSTSITHSRLISIGVSEDSARAVVGAKLGELYALDRATGQTTPLETGMWASVAIAYGTGNALAVGGHSLLNGGHWYYSPRLEQRAADAPVAVVSAWQDNNRQGNVRAVALTADSSQIFAAGDHFVAAFAPGQLEAGPLVLNSLENHTVNGISLLPGGQLLATSSLEGSLDIWRGATLELVTSIPIASAAGIARDRDGTRLFTAGADGELHAFGCE